MQTACAPPDVLQLQVGYLARTKPIVHDELKHRVVPPSQRCRAVNRVQESTDRWPWKRARKTFAAINPRCVDLRVQTDRDLAAGTKIPKE
jgi:hypothetical protein